jgi:hypothetical protein
MPQLSHLRRALSLGALCASVIIVACEENPTAPHLTPVTLSYKSCFTLPAWYAYRSDEGPWQRVQIGADSTASLSVGDRVTTAAVFEVSGGYDVYVSFRTRSQFQSIADRLCEATPGTTKTLHGSFGGTAGTRGFVSAAGATANKGKYPTFDITPPDIVLDIAAMRQSDNKTILRRNVTSPDGATLDVLDFDGTEAFDLAPITLTVNGIASGGSGFYGVAFMTSRGTWLSTDQFAGVHPGTFQYSAPATVNVIPSDRTVSGDVHEVQVLAVGPPVAADVGNFRILLQFQRVVSSETVALPPLGNLPGVATLASVPYLRLRDTMAVQSEVADILEMSWQDDAAGGPFRRVTLRATREFFPPGAQDWDVSIPDLTGIDGFQSTWMLQAGRALTWQSTLVHADYLDWVFPNLAMRDGHAVLTSVESQTTAALPSNAVRHPDGDCCSVRRAAPRRLPM